MLKDVSHSLGKTQLFMKNLHMRKSFPARRINRLTFFEPKTATSSICTWLSWSISDQWWRSKPIILYIFSFYCTMEHLNFIWFIVNSSNERFRFTCLLIYIEMYGLKVEEGVQLKYNPWGIRLIIRAKSSATLHLKSHLLFTLTTFLISFKSLSSYS